MKRIMRIYTAHKNDYGASKNNKTVVFEGCSIKEIIAELKRFSAITGVTYCEVAKVTYDITEE